MGMQSLRLPAVFARNPRVLELRLEGGCYAHRIPLFPYMRSSGQCPKDAYAKYALATCNDDVQTFLIVAGKVGKISIVGGTGLRYLQKQALLDFRIPVVVTAGQVGTSFINNVLGAERIKERVLILCIRSVRMS